MLISNFELKIINFDLKIINFDLKIINFDLAVLSRGPTGPRIDVFFIEFLLAYPSQFLQSCIFS